MRRNNTSSRTTLVRFDARLALDRGLAEGIKKEILGGHTLRVKADLLEELQPRSATKLRAAQGLELKGALRIVLGHEGDAVRVVVWTNGAAASVLGSDIKDERAGQGLLGELVISVWTDVVEQVAHGGSAQERVLHVKPDGLNGGARRCR